MDKAESPEFREAVREVAKAWEDLTQAVNEVLGTSGLLLDGTQLVRARAIDSSNIPRMKKVAAELRAQAAEYRRALNK